MSLRVLSRMLVALSLAANHVSAELPVLSDAETKRLARDLRDYDQGTLSYRELFKPGRPEADTNLAAYYFARSNSLTVKMKLPISSSLAGIDHFPEAAALAREYVAVYSNDWRGWAVIGGAEFFLKHYEASLAADTNAAALGDESNYAGLGFAAVELGRLDVFARFAPAILRRKDSEEITEDERLQLVVVLTGYANKAKHPEILLQAMRGITARQIESLPALKLLVRDSCEIFKNDKDVVKLCNTLKADPAWKPPQEK
jgi:hypothetical protein